MADIDASRTTVVYEQRGPARQAADSNANTLRQTAADALAANRSFIALTSPGAGVVSAHVKQMARQQNAIIRLLLGQLEGTD